LGVVKGLTQGQDALRTYAMLKKTRCRMKKSLFGAVALLLNVSVVFAEGGVGSRLDAYLVTTDVKGEEVFSPASEAEPGQVLEYRLAYDNSADQSFQKLVINGLVPANTEYVAKSARSEIQHDFLVSIDQGKTYHAEPVIRVVKQADGTEKKEIVPVTEYSHLRWKSLQALEPKQKQEYVYRVRVK